MPASWIFWAAVVCCAVAQVAILRSTLAVRSAPPEHGAARRSGRAAELLWVTIPAIVLALALLLSWREMHTAGADIGGAASAERLSAVRSTQRPPAPIPRVE